METSRPDSADINLLARFLAHPQIPDLISCPPVDCIVICASSVLYQATKLFRILLFSHPHLTKTLVLCGGIGHSTNLIYEAVSRHPIYHTSTVQGLPEAQVLEKILADHFDYKKLTSQGMKILIEDQSTNCGANASKTRQLLEKHRITPKSMAIVQDPTMALRTVASFQKVYENVEIDIKSAPIFVPAVGNAGKDGHGWDWDDHLGIDTKELWDRERFLDLLIGEIPRLRDNSEGYGPKGKGFIVHVDIPDEVEDAWRRLANTRERRR